MSLKNIFGEPGTGFHSIRFLDTALLDYLGTIIIAAAVSYKTKIPIVITTIILFIISILIHASLGVSTSSTTYIAGLNAKHLLIPTAFLWVILP